jgi:DNA-binding NarL/FixJ family response regulator
VQVLLVGAPRDRSRLRTGLDGSLRVAGEFDTLAAAELSGVKADAILMAPSDASARDSSPAELLTPREVQVLELLAEGLPNKAIAERLRISDHTVKFHVASISGKLGAANRTDAVRRAARRGLITL